MADATANPKIDEFLGGKTTPAWQRHAKWITLALVVVAVLFGAWKMFGGTEEAGYATRAVEKGSLTVTVSATGKLAPTNQVQVGSELSGLVNRVLVDVNDRVTAGQPLALIDPERLDDSITQARASVAAAQATVAQNQATLTEARSQLARFEEVSRLSGGRVPAKTELDNARAALARAVATVRASQAQVTSQQAALRSAVTQRNKAIIRSPVNGVVLARQVEPGQTVAASFNTPTLFVIAEDLSAMELEVAIDEADVGQVKQGQKASFTVDAFPGETFPAVIQRVDVGSNLSAQTTTSTTSTTAQVVSYAAILSVANPEQKLRPGMTATAEIVTLQKDNLLLVPNAALRFTPSTGGEQASSGGGMAGALVPRRGRRGQQDNEKSATITRGAKQTVYVKGEDGQPRAIEVTTGDTNGQVTEILSGDLKPGMEVITGQFAGDQSKGGQSKRGGGQRRSGGGGAGGGTGG
ncbi:MULTISPECIES: efflux RND transporter periplasmic adaptor subunit [unclassified Sphingomonas]|uniref:efflux RND transporter periplasmic adaptor subunit n=1 Tax=unclassified Sphingomonas TaxID=196159 RepID=UPI002150AC69|nr:MULTISPECIES: efflux RND transporter periplasmic adaptor subunit [unclassified Sphingomonas]MCR5871436.1 efflux RND transporter periplasmic adaptor subunit [Sphingomonas sp. J344]UUY00265.1 efflux RND transporter periplasmic adaptor subunit [Sphingomonas sp. J315]